MDFSILAFLPIVGLAVILYMTLWFFLARYAKRIDVIDLAWGLGFVYVAIFTLIFTGNYGWVQLLAALFVSVWGLRLASHIAIRLSKHGEDKRYVAFKEKWGTHIWAKAYVQMFLLQGLLLLLISSATIATLTSQSVVMVPLAIVGFIVWGFGITFEAVADYQLRAFLARNKGGIMEGGLWKYSRHPNYFGEITTWWGAGIVACSVGAWWGLLGGCVITFLLVKVSGIPTVEKPRANDPAYQAYKKRTSALLPLPPKN